jgi:hypothetical protein
MLPQAQSNRVTMNWTLWAMSQNKPFVLSSFLRHFAAVTQRWLTQTAPLTPPMSLWWRGERRERRERR